MYSPALHPLVKRAGRACERQRSLAPAGLQHEAAHGHADAHPEFIYKVVSRAVVRRLATPPARFAGMPIDAQDGYIHFSTAAQLRETLRLHFAGQGDLVLFAVRSADLGAGLRWEPSRGGAAVPASLRRAADVRHRPTRRRSPSPPTAASHLPEWVR